MCDKFGPKVQKLQKLFIGLCLFFTQTVTQHKSQTSWIIWQTKKPLAMIWSGAFVTVR